MLREKLFRDPVHDLISLNLDSREDELLLRLIDAPEVQRLRRIKQLGMAHMAYHGAEHSRFSHSIGVMHLARRMVERLRHDVFLDSRRALAVHCAALLHDVGHGPFSHVIENFFPVHHEEWSRRIVADPDTGVNHILRSYDSEFPAEVIAVMKGDAKPGWLNRVISSQLDADRLDYLLRDSHMTGVKYGVYDLERLLMMLRVHSDEERIIVSSKGLMPVEKYLQSRYQMYRQVYFHKAVCSAESMLMGVLDRACDLMSRLGSCPGVPDSSPLAIVLRREEKIHLRDYLALDDSVLLSSINEWTRCADSVLRELSYRLLNRRLFKSVEISGVDEGDLEGTQRIERAREIIAGAGMDPRFYLLFSKSSDTPYRPYSARNSKPGATIWIEDSDGVLRDVADVSPTVKAFTDSPYTIWRAYFPATDAEGRNLRDEIHRTLAG